MRRLLLPFRHFDFLMEFHWFGGGQSQSHRCSLAELSSDFDLSVLRRNKLATDSQAQSKMARCFRCYKRFEQVIARLLGKTRSRVGYGKVTFSSGFPNA